jgi:hypothetical protein
MKSHRHLAHVKHFMKCISINRQDPLQNNHCVAFWRETKLAYLCLVSTQIAYHPFEPARYLKNL